MKVVVIKEFRDKFHISHFFKEGEVLDFKSERAKDLIQRGLAKEQVEEKPEATPEKPSAPSPVATETASVKVETPVAAQAEDTNKVEESVKSESDAKAESEAKAKEAIEKAKKTIRSTKK